MRPCAHQMLAQIIILEPADMVLDRIEAAHLPFAMLQQLAQQCLGPELQPQFMGQPVPGKQIGADRGQRRRHERDPDRLRSTQGHHSLQ